MQLIKNTTKLKDQIHRLYKECFCKDSRCSSYDIDNVIDLKNSYAIIDNTTLVSFVTVVERTVIDKDEKEYKIALLALVMTSPEYRGHGYGLTLVDEVSKICMNEYDSVVIQCEHWDIYKDLDLIPTTVKKEYEYIKGEYPTPMVMTFSDPNERLMLDIEITPSDYFVGVERPEKEIVNNIKLLKEFGYKFIANPFAYIWYDNNKTIQLMSYNSAAQLTWAMHQIQPSGTFLLFNEPDLNQITCLRPTGKEVVVTKTFAGSKKVFNNLKIVDFKI